MEFLSYFKAKVIKPTKQTYFSTITHFFSSYLTFRRIIIFSLPLYRQNLIVK